MLDKQRIFGIIDSVAILLQDAQKRNFERWPVLGIYLYPNPEPHPETFEGEHEKLKDFINRRIDWLDANISNNCTKTAVVENKLASKFEIFPNPFYDEVSLTFYLHKPANIKKQMVNSLGEVIQIMGFGAQPAGEYIQRISTHELLAGIYFLQVQVNVQKYNQKLVKY
ncbi:MAG: T9SS type A sorting domain-containing protein [Bacteroidetes bacterium]|nr:T9SS type A sorting domain-containing protein [Bacteroidota bacterium]